MGIAGILILFLLAISVTSFLLISPQFGDSPTKAEQQYYSKLSYYNDGIFENLMPTEMSMSFSKILSILKDYAAGIPNQKPQQPLNVVRHSAIPSKSPDSRGQLIWFGHSAFFLQMNNINILIDPMFGESPSPVPFFGSKRFTEGLPVLIDSLPSIDLVLISHDHYDHLDYPTIKKISSKVATFFVPLGVAAHLRSWGIPDSKIREFQWWEEVNYSGITVASAPARHFSGRGLTDRFETLWCSWVIKSKELSVYFSGDGGYGGHFEEIGRRFGPFDIAMMECGQYDERWKEIHMMPEETAQAAKDVSAEAFMPVHWGAFVLALHSWDDPVKRVIKAAKPMNIEVLTPQIGEIVQLPLSKSLSNPSWWQDPKYH